VGEGNAMSLSYAALLSGIVGTVVAAVIGLLGLVRAFGDRYVARHQYLYEQQIQALAEFDALDTDIDIRIMHGVSNLIMSGSEENMADIKAYIEALVQELRPFELARWKAFSRCGYVLPTEVHGALFELFSGSEGLYNFLEKLNYDNYPQGLYELNERFNSVDKKRLEFVAKARRFLGVTQQSKELLKLSSDKDEKSYLDMIATRQQLVLRRPERDELLRKITDLKGKPS
jgi:hypothetical protein